MINEEKVIDKEEACLQTLTNLLPSTGNRALDIPQAPPALGAMRDAMATQRTGLALNIGDKNKHGP